MFKYIFCLIAILMQPIFAFLVFHKQEKQKAALKMPLLYLSVLYLVIQIVVFLKVCIKIPDDYQIFSYTIQAVILVIFLVIEIAMAGSNRYITRVQQQEQTSISDFKGLIQQLEICRVNVTDETNRKELDRVLDKMRYSDPVSSPAVAEENQKIQLLIAQLSETAEQNAFAEICAEIIKQLDIRKIKNTKEQG